MDPGENKTKKVESVQKKAEQKKKTAGLANLDNGMDQIGCEQKISLVSTSPLKCILPQPQTAEVRDQE